MNEQNRMDYKYIKNLRIITEIPSERDNAFRMKLSMNSNLFQFTSRINDRPELRPYFLMRFGGIEYKTGNDIPLYLYISGWETKITGIDSR